MCKLLLFVVDVKVVVAVVVVAVFFWLGQVHHVKKKKKRQQQLWNAISLLRLVAVSFAAVISLSVHQKGFNSRLLVCLFALVCALFTVRLAVCFSQFSIFNSFRGSSKLTFWNCASLFVWNTWEFCQQSIAWHQQIHGTTTLVSLCCCCCCCGFIIC